MSYRLKKLSLIIFLGTSLIIPVNAETKKISNGGKTEMEIRIENAAFIDVEIPLNTTFVLGDNSVFPDINIKNNSNIPLILTVSNVEKVGRDTPNIVSPYKYSPTEWKELSIEETETQLALGLKEKRTDSTTWFSDSEDILIGTLNPGTENIYNLTARHGLNWSRNIDLNYNINLKVNMAQ